MMKVKRKKKNLFSIKKPFVIRVLSIFICVTVVYASFGATPAAAMEIVAQQNAEELYSDSILPNDENFDLVSATPDNLNNSAVNAFEAEAAPVEGITPEISAEDVLPEAPVEDVPPETPIADTTPVFSAEDIPSEDDLPPAAQTDNFDDSSADDSSADDSSADDSSADDSSEYINNNTEAVNNAVELTPAYVKTPIQGLSGTSEVPYVYWNPGSVVISADGLVSIPVGSDINTGTTIASPLLTFERALAVSAAYNNAPIITLDTNIINSSISVSSGGTEVKNGLGYSNVSTVYQINSGTLTLTNTPITGSGSVISLSDAAVFSTDGTAVITDGDSGDGFIHYSGTPVVPFMSLTGTPAVSTVYTLSLVLPVITDYVLSRVPLAAVANGNAASAVIANFELQPSIAPGREEDTVEGEWQLVADDSTNTVYAEFVPVLTYDSVYLSNTATANVGAKGNDLYPGHSPAYPVATFARAREILLQQHAKGNIITQIRICGTVNVSSAQTWTLPEGCSVVPKPSTTTIVGYNSKFGLNGHGHLIVANANLTLENIVIGVDSTTTSYSYGSAIVANGAIVTMNSGATLKNFYKYNDHGGGFYIYNNGTLIMNSGAAIENCRCQPKINGYGGGGIYINTGNFTLNEGATISGCYARYGGAVATNGNSNVNLYGTIINCYARGYSSSLGYGGAVYACAGVANITVGATADLSGYLYNSYGNGEVIFLDNAGLVNLYLHPNANIHVTEGKEKTGKAEIYSYYTNHRIYVTDTPSAEQLTSGKFEIDVDVAATNNKYSLGSTVIYNYGEVGDGNSSEYAGLFTIAPGGSASTADYILGSISGDTLVLVEEGIYLNGVSGSDDNNGLSIANAVKTFAKAQELLIEKRVNDVSFSAKVFLCDTVTVSGTENWGEAWVSAGYTENIHILRFGNEFIYNDYMINVAGGDLTLTNIQLDGGVGGADNLYRNVDGVSTVYSVTRSNGTAPFCIILSGTTGGNLTLCGNTIVTNCVNGISSFEAVSQSSPHRMIILEDNAHLSLLSNYIFNVSSKNTDIVFRDNASINNNKNSSGNIALASNSTFTMQDNSVIEKIAVGPAITISGTSVFTMSGNSEIRNCNSGDAGWGQSTIVENGIVLVDPYDPDAFPVTDGRYEDMLTLGSMMAQIEIPAINVYLPIYHNTDEATLAIGVGHIPNTSLPVGGQQTHCVLTAHTGLPSAKLFTDLNKLVEGDIFYIHVLNRTLTYKVDQIKVVLPYEIDDLTITQDDFVTLLTCTPYGVNSHRLLVRGARINSNDNAVDNGINEPAQNAVANTFGRTPIDFFTPVIIVSAAAVLAVVLAVLVYAVSRRRKKR